MMRRDRDNPMPLYHQLAAHLREQIRSGNLPPGSRLAAETALSQQAGVSRMTARQAIALLVADGLVVVRHGVGTFVAEPKLTYDALHLLGFSETLAAQGGCTRSDVLEQIVEPAPPVVARELDLEAGAPVVKVRRIRRAQSEPLVLETSYLPAALCPGLEREDLAGRSLYALLENDFDLRLAGARQHFAARPAGESERELLALPEGGCVLVAWGVSEDDAGRLVEYFEAVYRADRCQFAVASRRPAGSGLLGPGADGRGRSAPVVAAAESVPLHLVLTGTDPPPEPPH
jgi:DNA-binding GntR family transcriptional regulator